MIGRGRSGVARPLPGEVALGSRGDPVAGDPGRRGPGSASPDVAPKAGASAPSLGRSCRPPHPGGGSGEALVRIEVHRAEFQDIAAFRESHRAEARCQLVADSLLGRGLADPYLIAVDGQCAGYGGVRRQIDPGRVMEFHTFPAARGLALPMFRAFLAESGATEIEAQTNVPLMLLMLYDCGRNIRVQNYLFADAAATSLPCPSGLFRQGRSTDAIAEPERQWVIDVDGTIVAHGGYLTHYNPPYADVYMEVAEPWRRQGFGSFLVQELKRVCYAAGRWPAARCNAENVASRRTLETAGLLPCGMRLLGDMALGDPGS